MNKKILTGIVLVGAIVLVAGIAYSAWYKKSKELNNVQPLSTQVDTTNWGTYTNDEYGFQFKHPDNLIVYEAKGSTNFDKRFTNVRVDTYKNIQLNKSTEGTEGLPIFLEIGASEPKNKPTISCGDFLSSKVVIGGVSATQCVGESIKGPSSMSIVFTKDGVVYYSVVSDRYSGEDKNLIDEIISTFKFTDNSNQKTYTNTQYGFEFNYPENYQLFEGEESLKNMPSRGNTIPLDNNFISGGEPVATVSMPQDAYPPNTDFSGAFFNVSINSSLNQTDCLKAASQLKNNERVYDQTLFDQQTINGVVFYKGSAGGVAAGSQEGNTYYHAYHNGTCFELIEGIRTAGYGAADTVTTQVDGTDVFNRLDKVLNTFKFTK